MAGSREVYSWKVPFLLKIRNIYISLRHNDISQISLISMENEETDYHWLDAIETPMIAGLLLMVTGVYIGHLGTGLTGALVILGAGLLNLLFIHPAPLEKTPLDTVQGT